MVNFGVLIVVKIRGARESGDWETWSVSFRGERSGDVEVA